MNQGDAIRLVFTKTEDSTTADTDSGIPDILQRVKAVLVAPGRDDLLIVFLAESEWG